MTMLSTEQIELFNKSDSVRRVHYAQLQDEFFRAFRMGRMISQAFNRGRHIAFGIEVDGEACGIGITIDAGRVGDGADLAQYLADWVCARKHKTHEEMAQMERIWPELAPAAIDPAPGAPEN